MELYAAYLRFFVAFPLVMILAWFGLRFLLPRFAPMLGMGRRIQVLERVALHSRAYLYVVKVGEDYLLLAAAPGSVTLLKDLGPDWAENSLLQETGLYGSQEAGIFNPGSFASLLELGYKGNNWKGPVTRLKMMKKKLLLILFLACCSCVGLSRWWQSCPGPAAAPIPDINLQIGTTEEPAQLVGMLQLLLLLAVLSLAPAFVF